MNVSGNLKMIAAVIIVILLSQSLGFGQCVSPNLPKTGKTIRAFVPEGWEIKDSVKGDFNNDKLEDAVIVLISQKEDEENNYDYDCNRPLVILQKTNTGYVLSAYTNEGVLCKRCGGAFGDPYESIEIRNNVLYVNHYGGSAWRWSRNYTFRFQQNKWLLIGCSDSGFWSLGECDGSVGESGYHLYEANFNTSKAHIVKTKGTDCKPYKDVWLSFKKKPLVTLQEFDVDTEYFPIKDKN